MGSYCRIFIPHIISAGEIRDVLLRHVTEQCCYGNHAAQEMNINRTVPSYAFHYKLTSFVEQRELMKIFQPYEGETIDRSRNSPGIWEIPVIPTQVFSEEEKTVVVPNSNEIKTCHKCRGTGKTEGFTCVKCNGSKRTMCKGCHGCGMLDGNRPCVRCLGKGTKKCLTCGGADTSVICPICKGRKKVLSHTVVHVKFRQIISDYVIDSAKSEIPKSKLYKARGNKLIDETSQRVSPVTTNPDSRINLKSQQLVTAHQQMAEQQRMFIHQQTHCLQILPITEVHWSWESKANRFWVYGEDHKVYFPSYPQNHCFGVCSLL
ncbi:protein SSUH2 homolog [Glandiceps talaboti]